MFVLIQRYLQPSLYSLGTVDLLTIMKVTFVFVRFVQKIKTVSDSDHSGLTPKI